MAIFASLCKALNGGVRMLKRSMYAAAVMLGTLPVAAQVDLDGSFPEGAAITFSAAHALAAANLNDPTSAQYKQMTLVTRFDGRQFICGWMNAKNSQGGYGNFYPFYVDVGLSKAAIGDRYKDPMMGEMVVTTFDMVGCSLPLGLR